MQKLFTLIFSLIIFHHTAHGRASLDSLVAAAGTVKDDSNAIILFSIISNKYALINADEGLKWAEKELLLARKIAWRKGVSMAYNDFGNHLESKGDFPAALAYYFKSLHILEESNDKYPIAVLTSNIGLFYQRHNDYRKALEWDLKALKLTEVLGDSQLIIVVTGNIGNVYQLKGQYEAALRYQLWSLHTAEAIHDKDIASQLGNIGSTYQTLKQYSKAQAYTFRALQNAAELGHSYEVAAFTGNAGENFYLIATDSVAAIPDSLIPATRAANLSLAVSYLRRSIDTCRKLHWLEGLTEFSPYLANALAAQGDYKDAMAAYREYVVIKDSLFNVTNTERISNLETKRAIALKDKDIEISKLSVAKKRNERIFYLSGISLLLIIIGIIVYNFRRHERSRRRIRELQDHKISILDETVKRRTAQLGSMRQTIATDFHDQTGNMLAAITRQAGTLELKLLHQPDVLPMVQSIIANAGELYASSRDFIWNLNHDSDDPLTLFQYLSSFGQRFFNQFDISFSTSVQGEPQPDKQLNPFAGLNLIYIFKEAINNVVKHSGADEVTMELQWRPDEALYLLRDNGAWKEPDTAIEHYGLSNIERRCQQSGFTFRLEHGTGGTSIWVGLPLILEHIEPLGATSRQEQEDYQIAGK